jgi:hypothetical protein
MGFQSGACKENERRNKVVRGFSKLEQSVPQGQLPTPQDELYSVEVSWVRKDFNAGQLFRLQSDHGTPR